METNELKIEQLETMLSNAVKITVEQQAKIEQHVKLFNELDRYFSKKTKGKWAKRLHEQLKTQLP